MKLQAKLLKKVKINYYKIENCKFNQALDRQMEVMSNTLSQKVF